MLQATIHNELIKNGWCAYSNDKHKSNTNSNSNSNKTSYRKNNPYDEFIINYISSDEVDITVPIPFYDSSLSYRSTFKITDTENIYEYIKVHLQNNIKS
jgi:hypothetical protein